MKHFVDLKPYFNFRMAYPKETALSDTRFLDARNCFFQDDLDWGGRICGGEAEIRLERTEEHDCVECDNQTVEIPNAECRKITIAGGCAWEYFREMFKIVFTDGTFAYAGVNFGDWALSHEPWIATSMEAEAREFLHNVLKECERRDGRVFIYYDATELPETKRVKRIIFPDNICMFILGITLEA
jgi:hypothetical protein